MSGRCASLQSTRLHSAGVAGAKFAGDGLVLKGPGNNMLHNWVFSPLSLACCTGLILDLRPTKERQRYIVTIKVSSSAMHKLDTVSMLAIIAADALGPRLTKPSTAVKIDNTVKPLI